MLAVCNGAATVENSLVVPQKLNLELADDPAVPLGGFTQKN